MFSRLIVGHEVWEEEKSEHAEYLIRKTTLSKGIAGRPLILYSGNESPIKAAIFQVTLEKLGVQSSFSRPRVSNDNPYSESLFKTMKYRSGYPFKGSSDLEESRAWVDKFVKWYNHEHLYSGINFLSPYQRYFGLDKGIMKKRIKTYEEVRLKHPERWSRKIRDWSLPEYVTLNPMSQVEIKKFIKSKS